MIRGGTGGGRTVTGLHFERKVNLFDLFRSMKNYQTKDNEIFYNKTKVAELFIKNQLYSKFLMPKGILYSKIISRKLLPDAALFVLKNNTMFIIEMKFQIVAGSVDEKLQTCDFKKWQYSKLLNPAGVSFKYVYILCDWFRDPRYADALKYVESVGCNYFYNELPLNFLGLPEP